MLVDAAVLFLLGGALIFFPRQMQVLLHFGELPQGVQYMLGLWGCLFLSLGLGYMLAATDPLRNLVWAQVGIARGVLETVLGLIYFGRGIVTFQQAGLGIILAVLFTLAYLAAYPRRIQAVP